MGWGSALAARVARAASQSPTMTRASHQLHPLVQNDSELVEEIAANEPRLRDGIHQLVVHKRCFHVENQKNESDKEAGSRHTMCPERNPGCEGHGREERPYHHEPVCACALVSGVQRVVRRNYEQRGGQARGQQATRLSATREPIAPTAAETMTAVETMSGTPLLLSRSKTESDWPKSRFAPSVTTKCAAD